MILAQQVYTSLTGKEPPTVGFAEETAETTGATSFEAAKPGVFETLTTSVGTLTTTRGQVLIDAKHATTGRQCLQLAGGRTSSVELAIAEGVNTDGYLTFRAERWTSRSPFSFRIEQQAGGKWTEIYNGDKQVKVGRPFLSTVDVPLGNAGIRKLRFTVTSPASTGILIDDLRIAPSKPQTITSVEVVPLALPALVGTESSALLKLKIEASGRKNPIVLTGLRFGLGGTTDLRDLTSVQLLSSGSNENFVSTTPFGSPQKPRATMNVVGQQKLAEGSNFVWIACKLDVAANIDHRLSVVCESVEFSNGKTIDLQSAPSIQNLGVAVRKAGDDGVHTYRIPGLATTKRGSLIAVYDVRHRSGGDLPGDIDVGMSRSTDGGRTWKPMKIIMDMGDDPDFRYDGIGDPTVLVDRTTGTIWCGATWSHGNRSWFGSQPGLDPDETGQFMLVRSDDDGVTWSKPINITKQVKKPEWSFLLQGPGKGITMSDGTLVMPAQYQDPPNAADKKVNRLPHSAFIYSCDHGKTWATSVGAFDDTTEAQVVELADGQLMINCRYNRESKRVVMTTTDMGKTWVEHPSNLKALIEPRACMASIINVGREFRQLGVKNNYSARNDVLLFSNPDSLNGRNHITIKASFDGGKTWPADHHLLLDEERGAGYSCLTMIDAETVGIIYESSQAHMTFQRVKLADIVAPPKNQKTKSPAHASLDSAAADSTKNTLEFARVFGDNMVLQAGRPIRIWGNAKPGAAVSVRIGKAAVEAKSGSDGRWLATLPALEHNKTAQTVTATSGDDVVSIDNVLIGEVWFCAGQSNMEWPLGQSAGGQQVIAESEDSHLRLMNFVGAARGGLGVYAEEMLARMTPERFGGGSWKVASPKSSPKFSAVGYYFARELRKKLDCPIGMINVSIGGTPIEAWISSGSLREHASLAKMVNGNWLENPSLDDWCKERGKFNLKRVLSGELSAPSDQCGPNHSFKPGFMYASAVKPFTPMSIRGVVWYQGESNAENPGRARQYDAAFPLLVSSWREAFRSEKMPIGFVQLPAMGRANWPVFREYQRRSLAKLTDVGMAVTIDTGDKNNVHPTTKKPVGERLARWALASSYGHNGPAMGPLYRSKTVDGDSLVLTFDTDGDKLAIAGETNADRLSLNQFEVAGDDRVFHAATARLAGTQVVIRSKNVPRPKHARYAWADFPHPAPNLVNSFGLPASPFTTVDDFVSANPVVSGSRIHEK